MPGAVATKFHVADECLSASIGHSRPHDGAIIAGEFDVRFKQIRTSPVGQSGGSTFQEADLCASLLQVRHSSDEYGSDLIYQNMKLAWCCYLPIV